MSERMGGFHFDRAAAPVPPMRGLTDATRDVTLDPVFGPAGDPAIAALREAVALAEPAPPSVDDDLPLEATEAPLRRYLAWQVRDFLRQRAVFMLPLAMVGIWLLWDNYRPIEWMPPEVKGGQGRFVPMSGAQEAEYFGNVSRGLMTLFAALGAPLAFFGLVARDRDRGLQRLLFAKPVSIVRFYLQRLAVHAVGYGAVLTVALLALALVFQRAVPAGEVALMVVCLGTLAAGVTFLASTLIRYDAPIAALLCLASLPAHGLAHDPWRWAPLARAAELVLPPLHAMGPVLGASDAHAPSLPLAVAWMLGYGVLCIVAGVVVLRRRAITV